MPKRTLTPLIVVIVLGAVVLGALALRNYQYYHSVYLEPMNALEMAEKAYTEGRLLEADNHLVKVAENYDLWKEKGYPLYLKIEQKKAEIEAPRLAKLQEKEDRREAAVTKTHRSNIEKARQALDDGQIEEAQANLRLIPRDSRLWRQEGSALESRIEGIEKYGSGMVRFSWKRGGFDNVAIIDITIRNTSSDVWKDIAGIVTFSARSGTELGSLPFVIYDTIAPRSVKTFRNLNIGLLPSPADQISGAEAKVINRP